MELFAYNWFGEQFKTKVTISYSYELFYLNEPHAISNYDII